LPRPVVAEPRWRQLFHYARVVEKSLWYVDCTPKGGNLRLQGLDTGEKRGKMTERRAARRYDLSLPVIIRVPVNKNDAGHNGRTRDISTRGVYFTLDQDLDSGTELDITLTLPAEITQGTEVFVRAHGHIVRVDRRNDDGTVHIGVAAVLERYDIIRGEQSTPPFHS
jgi:hypothetical protein